MSLARRLLALIAFAVIVGPAAGAQAKSFAGIVPDVAGGAGRLAAPVGGHSVPARGHAVPVARAANLPYGGGPVLHSNRTHVIFWQPAGSGLRFTPGYVSLVKTFLAQVAADSHRPTNVYGLTGQYTDANGPAAYDSSYRGAIIDTHPLPANGCSEPAVSGPGWAVCLNDSQLEAEITRVVSADRLPTGADDIYFLLTPDGFGSCIDASSSQCALGGGGGGYCGYHSTAGDGLLYAVIPYNAVSGHCQSDNPRPNSSTADPTISSLSHEHNETITDPQGDAWVDSSQSEDGDLCLSAFGPNLGGAGAGAWDQVIHGGHYYIQEEWSNQAGSCQPRAKAESISFTASGQAKARSAVLFSGHASDPTGTIRVYDWFFGDGHTGHGRRLRHTFARSGAYRVVLRTVDSWDNYGFSAVVVRVAGAGARSGAKR